MICAPRPMTSPTPTRNVESKAWGLQGMGMTRGSTLHPRQGCYISEYIFKTVLTFNRWSSLRRNRFGLFGSCWINKFHQVSFLPWFAQTNLFPIGLQFWPSKNAKTTPYVQTRLRHHSVGYISEYIPIKCSMLYPHKIPHDYQMIKTRCIHHYWTQDHADCTLHLSGMFCLGKLMRMNPDCRSPISMLKSKTFQLTPKPCDHPYMPPYSTCFFAVLHRCSKRSARRSPYYMFGGYRNRSI